MIHMNPFFIFLYDVPQYNTSNKGLPVLKSMIRKSIYDVHTTFTTY